MFEMFSAKVVGLILDLDLRLAPNGKSHLSSVASCLSKNVATLSDEDIIYVYNPSGDLAVNNTPGEGVAAISNYREQPFDLSVAIKETVYLFHEQGVDEPQSIFIFTNRYKQLQEQRIKKAVTYPNQLYRSCHFSFYGIGNHYNRSLNELTLLLNAQVSYKHFDDPGELNESFTQMFSTLISER